MQYSGHIVDETGRVSALFSVPKSPHIVPVSHFTDIPATGVDTGVVLTKETAKISNGVGKAANIYGMNSIQSAGEAWRKKIFFYIFTAARKGKMMAPF